MKAIKSKQKKSDSYAIDEKGRVRNNEIPDDFHRRSAPKSKAEKRLKLRKQADAEREALKTEEPKKKRRKKTVGELLKSGNVKAAQKKLSKLNASASSFPAVVEQVESVDLMEIPNKHVITRLSSESDFISEYQELHDKLKLIINRLEDKMLDKEAHISGKDVYALMTMYSQFRETIADMRSIRDLNEQAEILASDVFDPAMKSAGEALVTLFHRFMKVIRHHVSKPSEVEALQAVLKTEVSSVAVTLRDNIQAQRDRIITVMGGSK